MTIPPIPLKPMVWLARANGWAAGSYDIARQENGWRLYGPIKDHPYGLIRASAESKDHPTLAAAQAAAEADEASSIAARLDPARLTQWAAGVLLASRFAQSHHPVSAWLHGDGCTAWHFSQAVETGLRARAGEAGQ